MSTVTLSKAISDLTTDRLGPTPKVGWIAALEGNRVVMVAGRPCFDLLRMNADAQGWPVVKIVKG